MRYCFIILFSFFVTSSSAQVHKGFRWIDNKHVVFSVDLKTGILSRSVPNKEKLEIGQLKNWENIKKELPNDFDVNIFYYKQQTLLTIPGTGHLYILDVSSLTLNRIDQTFFRGYNFNANQFIRKDTIVRLQRNLDILE